jgi:hypothetical protein
MCYQLQNDIQTSDALIVSGFSPHIDLLKYFNNSKPKIFIGYSNTNYDYKNEFGYDVIQTLLYKLYKKDNNTLNKFSKYYFINKETGDIVFNKDTYTKYLDVVNIFKKNETENEV